MKIKKIKIYDIDDSGNANPVPSKTIEYNNEGSVDFKEQGRSQKEKLEIWEGIAFCAALVIGIVFCMIIW